MAERVVIDLVEDEEEEELACREAVLTVFPDICPDHLAELNPQYAFDPDDVIMGILDRLERGERYPTRPHDNPLKRKREDDGDASDEDSGGNDTIGPKEPETTTAMRSEIATPDYAHHIVHDSYQEMSKVLLSQDFPRVPVRQIWTILREKRTLFDAYAYMDEVTRNWENLGGRDRPWIQKKTSTLPIERFNRENIGGLDMDDFTQVQKAAIAEFRAARELRDHNLHKDNAELEENANFLKAQRDGQTAECGCCYDEKALNRMAQCDGETAHFFCGNCVRQQAETQIGYQKFELKCMSMDGCSAGFSIAERKRFLSKGLRTTLDRIEQEAMLREAGIENLETCPFCPYAAEYPPVEEDKEFRCERPGCKKVSCRLCRKETHIPKTCAEVSATEEGLTARREIEEAMSDAVIRKCNKCKSNSMAA